MGVAVYPRLDELLRERMLTVAELERRIKLRFGLNFDPKTLYRLAQSEPIQRADLKIAGAVAETLGVKLDDLFDIQASPVNDEPEMEMPALSSKKSRRLAELFDQQSRRTLLPDEQQELDELVGDYVHTLEALQTRRYATMRGISIEDARREMAAQFNKALDGVKDFEADTERQREILVRARVHRARAAG